MDGAVRKTTPKLFLVRHAKAAKRTRWEGPDRLRPLTTLGHRQAEALIDVFDGVAIDWIFSSPYLRCRQSVEPLAAQRKLPLRTDPRLAEGEGIEGALALIELLRGEAAVLSTHGDLIPELLDRLSQQAVRVDETFRCDKGSIWVVESSEDKPPKVEYWLPPEPVERAQAPEELLPAHWKEDAAQGPRIAVMDLGSTSFHLIVAETSPRGRVHRILRERIMLRLGASIADRRVPKAVSEKAVETARALKEVAMQAGADQLLPVATAALREVENGAEVTQRISEAVGEPVRILSGEEEARLIFAAFWQRVAVRPGLALGLDLGGGSLELAVGDSDGVHWETTMPLGVARLHSELVDSDPISDAEADAIRARVRKRVGAQASRIARDAPGQCVTTGGTIGALARMVRARRGITANRTVNEMFIPLAEFSELTEELLASDHAERLEMPGIQKRRADLLPTGALVLECVAQTLGLEGYTVSDWGLREGIILEALGLAKAARGGPS